MKNKKHDFGCIETLQHNTSKDKMHHFYQPFRPVSNLCVQKRVDDDYYYKHLKKVYDIQLGKGYQSIYSKSPLKIKFPHLQNHNREKLQNKFQKDRIKELRRRCFSETKKCVDDRYDYQSKSLQFPKRQNDILKQSEENLNLMSRIVHIKPVVSQTEHRKEWDKQKNYGFLASKYPNNWKHILAEENENKKKEFEKIRLPQRLPKLHETGFKDEEVKSLKD